MAETLPDADRADVTDDVAVNDEGLTDWEAKAKAFESDLTAASKSIEDLKKEQDRNIRRIQGTLQTQINARDTQSESDRKRWENAYHDEKMSGMEEAEALRYDNSRMAEELQTAENTAQTLKGQVADAQAKTNYISHFTGLGVPLAELNTQGSLQELSDSGYLGLDTIRTAEKSQLTDTRAALEAQATEIEKLKNAADPNRLAESQGDRTPDRVATHTHGDAGGSDRTWEDAMKQATNITGRPVTEEEEVWRLVEQKILSPSVIPGLENPDKE